MVEVGSSSGAAVVLLGSETREVLESTEFVCDVVPQLKITADANKGARTARIPVLIALVHICAGYGQALEHGTVARSSSISGLRTPCLIPICAVLIEMHP